MGGEVNNGGGEFVCFFGSQQKYLHDKSIHQSLLFLLDFVNLCFLAAQTFRQFGTLIFIILHIWNNDKRQRFLLFFLSFFCFE